MAVYYLETSALLKRYRTEKGTEVLDELFQGKQESEVFTTSYFTVPEVTSVATRLLRSNSITRHSYNRLLGQLSQDLRHLIMLQSVSDSVLSEAVDFTMDYALRAPDALQIATALSVRSRVSDQPFYVLCTDSKLKTACENSNLVVLDPEATDSLEVLKGYRSRE